MSELGLTPSASASLTKYESPTSDIPASMLSKNGRLMPHTRTKTLLPIPWLVRSLCTLTAKFSRGEEGTRSDLSGICGWLCRAGWFKDRARGGTVRTVTLSLPCYETFIFDT